MPKKDELDQARAAAFAWRTVTPGEAEQLLQDEEAPPEGASLDELRRHAHRACQALAAQVDRSWTLPDHDLPDAVEAMLLRAQALGFGAAAMCNHPLQSVRLMRLAARCWPALPTRTREALLASSTWLSYDHPELLQLLVEIAQAGAREMVTPLMMSLSPAHWKQLGQAPDLVERLARVIDEGPGHLHRRIAVDWVSMTGGRGATAALRRALRLPHFVLRHRALATLERHFAGAIEASDVCFLLQDFVDHAPPSLPYDDGWQARLLLPELLDKAVVRLRPPDAVEPLLCLVEGRCDQDLMRDVLNDTWALSVLAAAFPEVALPIIDRKREHNEWDRRLCAVRATTRLPDELARPRLLAASADPVPAIAAIAEDAWRKRFASSCPREPAAGLLTELLDAPPSDTTLSRLDLLRRASLEARAAMVEVLLAEAPDPQALVLLLFATSDSGLWERKPRPGLPTSSNLYAQALVERFGAPAVRGLILLQERYPRGRFGWISILADLLRQGVVPAPALPPLREAAERRLLSPLGRDDHGALAILAALGSSPSFFELLWPLSLVSDIPRWKTSTIAAALGRCAAGDEGRDAFVWSQLEASVDDLPRFACVAAVALQRRLPQAPALVLRVLDERGAQRPSLVADLEALADCADLLREARLLPEGWEREALRRQGTCAFFAAIRPPPPDLTPEHDQALRAALVSDEPCCAAQAAVVLLFDRLLEAGHPSLLDIAARAPSHLRAELLNMMLYRGAEPRPLWPLIEPLLTSADPRDHKPLHALYWLRDAGLDAELIALLPRIVDPAMRDEINALCKRSLAFWQDPPQDDRTTLFASPAPPSEPPADRPQEKARAASKPARPKAPAKKASAASKPEKKASAASKPEKKASAASKPAKTKAASKPAKKPKASKPRRS